MAPKLYMIPASPPVRAVQMTAKSIGLSLELKEVNLANKDHFTPEYLKLNPAHTVPTLEDDDGFIIWDSHAIMTYLVSKYGKNNSLYPKDIQKRAIIDQRLHFDSGTLFSRSKQILRPMIYNGKKTIDEADHEAMVDNYGILETFLNGKQWIAGDSPTIADYSIITTLTTIDVAIPVDPKKFPKLTAWMKKCETLPVYDENKKGLDIFIDKMKPLLA